MESSTGAHTPQTIIVGSTSNYITNCTGVMDFGSLTGSNFAASNVTGNFTYTGPVLGDAALLTAPWTQVYGGFPSGWAGNVKYRLIGNGDLVFFKWAFGISNGTVVSAGETVVTVPAGFYYTGDNVVLAGNLTGGGLSNAVAFLEVNNSGTVSFQAAGFTVSGTSYFYGQGVYSIVT